jgi:UDP-GlcNAc:undecaprenyl-phosphate GlcNAc-1-phosphate transferase
MKTLTCRTPGVSLTYLVHGLMVSCAYLLRWQSGVVLIGLYLLFAAAIISMFARKSHQPLGAEAPERTSVRLLSSSSQHPRLLRDWPHKILQLLVPLYLVVSVAIPRHIPWDAGMIGAGLLVAVSGATVFGRGMVWAVRAGLYVDSTCLLYYSDVFPRFSGTDLATPVNIWFALLAGLVVLAIRFAGADRFETTPLDYLIVLLAVVMPFLPDVSVGEVPVSLLTAKLIVLFFAFELLLHAQAAPARRLGWVSALMLGGLALRAWWP